MNFIESFLKIYFDFHKDNFFYFTVIFFLIFFIPILFKRINLPFVFGYILLGIILGPNSLGILERTPAIEFFAKFGILYIMFLAGLELDLNEFLKNKNRSIVFGSSTFFIPLILAFLLCYYILDYGFLASLLTASMFSTHTLLSYPIVSKFGLVKREEVAISVGGTIITDTAVLLLFIFIVNHSKGNLNLDFIFQFLILFTIFFLIMFFLIPKIAGWFFQKIEGEKYSQLAFVFTIIFFSAYLSEISYLEPIIGAFASGIALNRLIPNSSVLMSRIEFIGNTIFIPIFMIFVGMIININLLFKDWNTFKIAIILSIGAIISKGIASYFLKLVFPYSWNQVNLIFGLTSAHAAATLAVILVGFELKIIDEYILNGTIILIMLTSLFSSFLTEFVSKKIILEEETKLEKEKELDTQETVLIPVVNLEKMHRLIEFSLLITSNHSVGSLNILTVVPNDELAESNILKAKAKIENYILHNSIEDTKKFNIIAAIDQNPVSGITTKAKETMADLVILGWPTKATLLEKFIGGEKLKNIINNIYKNIFICDLQNSLTLNKRIILFLANHSEKEYGFEFALKKIFMISLELNIPLYILCNQTVYNYIQNILKKEPMYKKINLNFISYYWNEWPDLEIIFQNIQKEDLVVFLCSRKGYISYMSIYDSIFDELNSTLKSNNKIVIYPQQSIVEKVIV